MYPTLLDISSKAVLIVGGGAVAARKARGLLDSGAKDVRAVAPEFKAEFPPAVRRITRTFQDRDLDGIALCLAATDDPAVNSTIVQLCNARRILVNRADRDTDLAGDFTVPAVHRTGTLTVAVSAGESPAVAAMARDFIAEELGDSWGEFAKCVSSLRRELISREIDPSLRQQITRSLGTRESFEVFSSGGEAALRAQLASRFGSVVERQAR